MFYIVSWNRTRQNIAGILLLCVWCNSGYIKKDYSQLLWFFRILENSHVNTMLPCIFSICSLSILYSFKLSEISSLGLLEPNLTHSEAVVQRCSVKKLFLQFCEIHRKTPVPNYLLLRPITLLKNRLWRRCILQNL